MYGVKIIKKFLWESGFLKGGSIEPPLCTNGSAGYLMQLSVKIPIAPRQHNNNIHIRMDVVGFLMNEKVCYKIVNFTL